MEKHPIERWDQWVHSELHPAVLLQSAQVALNGNLAAAKALKEALKMQLLRDTLYNKTEKEIELLVERYQIKMASLLNQLFHYQHYESLTPALKQFYQAVAAQLETIIVLLQNDYGRYFNANLHLPPPSPAPGSPRNKKAMETAFQTGKFRIEIEEQTDGAGLTRYLLLQVPRLTGHGLEP